MILPVFFVGLALPLQADLDLYVSDFTVLNGTSGATGVWKNNTTGSSLGISLGISQSGGMVKPADGSGTASVVDDSFPWQALTPPLGTANPFDPHFDGDYINIETQQGETTTITLDFGAMITDPIISFTDVENRSTITFTDEFAVRASTSNLHFTTTTLSSNASVASGDNFTLFGKEAAGSIQFSGTFSQIVFTVFVGVPTPLDPDVGSNDRTGYVVSTFFEPMTLPTDPPPAPPFWIMYDQGTGNVTLSWILGDFEEIQMSDPTGLMNFMAIPDLDPGVVDSWTRPMSELGSKRFFRGTIPSS